MRRRTRATQATRTRQARPVRSRAGLVALLLCAASLAGACSSHSAAVVPDTVERPVATGTPSPAATVSRRPNILLVTADDMSRTDLRWMPATRRLVRRAGVEVTDFISNHPLCCPARAQILTGQQGHNSGVHDNGGRYGGYRALERPGNHVGAWLREAGYRTAFVGKHLNGWPVRAQHQAGWTVFDPILDNVYAPYDLTMFNNGRPRTYPGVHTSDLIGGLTVRYINRFSATRDPFFIWASQVAPHGMFVDGRWGPPVPAARHRGLYPDALPPSLRSPAFNEADVSDKPGWIRATPPVTAAEMIAAHRARIRSLRSVDEQVAAAVRALRANGRLANTYLFFTSDNGYLLGEHRLTNKNKPYEESLGVPLVVRGPGLPRGVRRAQTYGLADLAPTFAAIAGAQPRRRLDGRSMLATLRRGARGYDHYLIQAAIGPQSASTGPFDGVVRPWWWRGVRSREYVYVRYQDGAEELYDRRRDPAQTHNVALDPRYAEVRTEYAARTRRLATCAGWSCRTGGARR